MTNLIVLIVAIIIISYGINMLLLYSVGGMYRLFVAPGIILHELSHAFACLITGAPIESINVFKKDGGDVKHGKPKIPVIGQLLISLAPFVVGALAIYFLSKLLGINDSNVSDLSLNTGQFVDWIKHAFTGTNLTDWKSWVAIYLVLSIAVTMTPSSQDMKNIAFSLIFIAILVFVIYKFTSFRPDLSLLSSPNLLIVLSTTLILLMFAFVLSIFVFAIKSVVKPI